MMKRAAITGITRDKEYNITRGTNDSKILYLSVNPNGEAEVIKIYLKPRPRLRNLLLEVDFGDLAIKGRDSVGNLITKYPVQKIVLKEKGVSTLGGRKIWFDDDVFRLNADGRGKFLGEFSADNKLLILTRSGKFRVSSFDLSNHFEEDVIIIEKYNPNKVFSIIYYDATQKFYYVKRFNIDPSEKPLSFIGDDPESKLIALSEVEYPRFEVNFSGKNKKKKSEIIEVAEFISIKSYKAKGKRLTKHEIDIVNQLEPDLPGTKGEDSADKNIKTEESEILDSPINDRSQMTLDFFETKE